MRFLTFTLVALPVINALQVSRNSRCGASFGLTCKGSKYGDCCSKYGYCGSSSDYCKSDNGCQSGFGSCSGTLPSSSTQKSTLQTSARASTSSSPSKSASSPSIPPISAGATDTVTQVVTVTASGNNVVTTVTVPTTVTLPAEQITNAVTDVTTVIVPTTVTLPASEVITTTTVTVTDSFPTTVTTCAAPNPSVTQAVVNPSFETNDAWTFANGAFGSFAYVDGDQNSGSRSLRYTATVAQNLAFSFSQTVTLFPGGVYRLDLYTKANVANNCLVSRATIGTASLTFASSIAPTSYGLKSAVYYPVDGQTSATLTVFGSCAQAQANPRTVSFDDVTLTLTGFYTAA